MEKAHQLDCRPACNIDPPSRRQATPVHIMKEYCFLDPVTRQAQVSPRSNWPQSMCYAHPWSRTTSTSGTCTQLRRAWTQYEQPETTILGHARSISHAAFPNVADKALEQMRRHGHPPFNKRSCSPRFSGSPSGLSSLSQWEGALPPASGSPPPRRSASMVRGRLILQGWPTTSMENLQQPSL